MPAIPWGWHMKSSASIFGSVHSTSADPSVTEVTAGSGFLCPHLFDGYDRLPLDPEP